MAIPKPKQRSITAEAETLLIQTLAECEESAAGLQDLFRLATALVALLPPERRNLYSQSVALLQSAARPTKGAAINDNIIQILQENKELSANEVCNRLLNRGVPVDRRRVNNSLDYLARRGALERIGRGKYRIAGLGVGIEGDVGNGYE